MYPSKVYVVASKSTHIPKGRIYAFAAFERAIATEIQLGAPAFDIEVGLTLVGSSKSYPFFLTIHPDKDTGLQNHIETRAFASNVPILKKIKWN